MYAFTVRENGLPIPIVLNFERDKLVGIEGDETVRDRAFARRLYPETTGYAK
jgi:hypothetical protein